jgi:glucosylceramidase
VVADQYATTRVRLAATDRDRDRLAYYATDLPGGVTLDAATGVLTLQPTVPGEQHIRVTVTDGRASDDVPCTSPYGRGAHRSGSGWRPRPQAT